MSVLDNIKGLADDNGKISFDKLLAMKDSFPLDKFEELKQLADQNDDGSINIDDLKDIKFDSFIGEAKNVLGDLFGKK